MSTTGENPGTSRSLEALFAEALARHQQGDMLNAERQYRAILASDGGHYDTLVHLGMVRLQERDLDEATRLFREAVSRKPESAEPHAYLANALLAQSRFDEAAEEYDRALAIDSKYAEAHFGLASTLRALKCYDEALPFFERALQIDPDYAEAACGLAVALQKLDRHDEAVPLFERALEIDPDYLQARYGLATALQSINKHAEAISQYDQALVVAPHAAIAHYNRGAALMEIGRFGEARLAFERAIDLEPTRAMFYGALFELQKASSTDRHFVALKALAEDMTPLSVDDRIDLHFALGHAYSQIAAYPEAFRHSLEGNALKRSQIAYDEADAMRMVDSIRAVFTDDLMRAKAGCGNPSALPIFIVGMPRSGSTLIEQILASHPLVFAAGERLEFARALNGFTTTRGIGLPFFERFRFASGKELRRLGTDYLGRLTKATDFPLGAHWRRITDKLPANFRVLGPIHLALPNARIIHSRRNPVDTCLSCFSTLFAADQPFAYDLGELGRYYRSYAGLMAHWNRVLPAGLVLEVDYEELVADFEPQARRILEHCGLEWDDACLAFDKAVRPVRTASMVQVRQPVYKTSVNRPLPAPELLRPLYDGLGPELLGAVPRV
ncbi:MAG: tetratricopeptide repeat protein [Rhodospirillales bacterium]|nr:tetratricopeptide repeat protein [Rhodospirillales bacterium]